MQEDRFKRFERRRLVLATGPQGKDKTNGGLVRGPQSRRKKGRQRYYDQKREKKGKDKRRNLGHAISGLDIDNRLDRFRAYIKHDEGGILKQVTLPLVEDSKC